MVVFFVLFVILKACMSPEILVPCGFNDVLRQHEVINARRTEVIRSPAVNITFNVRLNTNNIYNEELLIIRESIIDYILSDSFSSFVEQNERLSFDFIDFSILINNRSNERLLTVSSSHWDNHNSWPISGLTNEEIIAAARIIPENFISIIAQNEIVVANSVTWNNDRFNYIRITLTKNEMWHSIEYNVENHFIDLKTDISSFLQSSMFYYYVNDNMHLRWGDLNISLTIKEPGLFSNSFLLFTASQRTNFEMWENVEQSE